MEKQYTSEKSEEEPQVFLSVKSEKNGEKQIGLSTDFLPGIIITGNIEENEEGFSFFITGVQMFCNWAGGWTSGEYEASGLYEFKSVNNSTDYLCREVDPFELWDITMGEIRYKDKYYRENKGIWKVKNRIDRIREVTRWMHGTGRFEEIYGDIDDSDDLKKYLFPEMSRFKRLERKGELPEEFYTYISDDSTDPELIGRKQRGSGIPWRMDYTAAVLPSEFHDLRNSGTIWRDFEEAPELFFSFYNLNSFFDKSVKDQIFKVGDKL